jgi:hypothetical protein
MSHARPRVSLHPARWLALHAYGACCWPQILKWLSNNIEEIPIEVLQDACRQQAEYEAR